MNRLPHDEDSAGSTGDVLAWIRNGEQGAYSSTRFDNLAAGAQLKRSFCTEQEQKRFSALARHASDLHTDWGELLTLLVKVEWMRTLAADQLGEQARQAFLALDIQQFYVIARSAMDQLAKVIGAVCPIRGQVPESFNKVLSWVRKDAGRAAVLLSSDLVEELTGAGVWFAALKDVRDKHVHRGGFTLVYPDPSGVPFQSYERGDGLVSDPAVMHNENLADFQSYAATTLASMWRLIERVSRMAFTQLELPQLGLGEGMMAYHTGLSVLGAWLDRGGPIQDRADP